MGILVKALDALVKDLGRRYGNTRMLLPLVFAVTFFFAANFVNPDPLLWALVTVICWVPIQLLSIAVTIFGRWWEKRINKAARTKKFKK